MKNIENKVSTINAVDRALKLVDVLFYNGKEMGISEIAKEMNEYKSTIHRTLTTLAQHGYVVQNVENEKYGLGYKLYAIGAAVDNKFALREAVKPFADELLEEFGEAVNVAIVDSSSDIFRFLVIYRNEGKSRVLRMNSLASSNCECHCSSLGKSLLAFTPNFPSYIQDSPLASFTRNTITNKNDFINHLNLVKQNGYAMDSEELEIGLTCIGVPVLNKNKETLLAISISGLTSRIARQEQEVVQKLKDVAFRIASKLQ